METQPKKRSRVVTLFLSCFRICFYSSLGAAVVAVIFGMYWAKELSSTFVNDAQLDTIINYQPVDNTLVYDREGNKIGEIFTSYHVMIPYEKLPPDLIKAIVAIEDRRFFNHDGVDPRGIMRAIYDRLRNQESHQQGASTLTQQLVRHFLLSKERSIDRKIREIILSVMLEKRISKEKILELYTNVLFMGNGSYGVGAAAQRYFDKKLAQLETHELALLAGLFQSPSRYNPHRYPQRAKARQKQVLQAMYDTGMLTKAQYDELVAKPLVYKEYKPISDEVAPYFVDYIKDQAESLLSSNLLNKGLRIYTTLDPKLQKLAKSTLAEKKDIFDLAGRLVIVPYESKGEDPEIQGAMVSSNPKTGEILAMVGGRDYQQSKFNRTVQALRQPGSSFKPIIYSLALSKNLKWSDLLYIGPISIDNYRPKNFSNTFLTETTMLKAFYKSVNTPAVEIGARLGLQNVIDHAYNLGIKTPLKVELGTMIGSSDVTMLDMMRVYNSIANLGKRVDLYAISKVTNREGKVIFEIQPTEERTKDVMAPQDAYLMLQGMRAVFLHGTAYAEHDMGEFAAGKTGTSNKSKDNWFCGFTPNLTTVVWVGSDKSFDFLGSATGTALALPIWASYMRKAIAFRAPPPFTEPPGIVSYRVNPQYGQRSGAGVTMYFKQGHEPSAESSPLQVLSDTGKYRAIFDN